jgi:hypothetical protein
MSAYHKGFGHGELDDLDDWREQPAEEEWPPEIEKAAYQGLAGEIIEVIAPHTEASPIALLVHLLTFFGNAAGRASHCRVSGTAHYAVEFGLVVGRSARARKGTALNAIERLFAVAAPEWTRNCRHGGLSSGEGLLRLVNDAGEPRPDRRAMVCEPEFAGTLEVIRREGNILTRVLREFWDCRPKVATLTKNDALAATDAHVSVIAHSTLHELRERLRRDPTLISNGFLNRFLTVLVKRGQILPFGSEPPRPAFVRVARDLAGALELAGRCGRVDFAEDAKEVWAEQYYKFSNEIEGPFGDLVARAEAHCLRLALQHSLLNSRREIEVAHLDAAFALWRHAEASLRSIFGSADPLAQKILSALRSRPGRSMTSTEIRDLFNRNTKGRCIRSALKLLLSTQKVMRREVPTPGRPAEVWTAL